MLLRRIISNFKPKIPPRAAKISKFFSTSLDFAPPTTMKHSTFITKTDFLSHYPALKNSVISFFTSKCKLYCPKVPFLWLEKLLDYNVPNGKLNRGLTLVHAYQCLNDDISQEDLHKICKLGWTIELLESCFLIADDVMDSSITRRGKPCWYKNDDIGFTAINDAFLLENAADLILSEILGEDERYLAILNIYREAKLFTMLGQHMDSQKFDINLCSKERYFDITRCKTSYYTFVLPVLAAVRMSPIMNHQEEQLKNLCIKMGHYFQCQDDYLDCYGNADVTGKIGTDIEDGKCTWLLVEALAMATREEKKIIEENYAKSDQSNVKIIKNLYDSLNLRTKYEKFEAEQFEILTEMIENLTLVKLKPLFLHLLTLLRGMRLYALAGAAIFSKFSSLDNDEDRRGTLLAKAEFLATKFKEERGVPGLAVGVAIDGRVVWRKGFGYSDVENLTPCTTNTVMRIASISKPITMTLAAKLMTEKVLDLDCRVQNYVPDFPEKYFKGEKVDITTRHLVSHVSGIRGYAKADSQKSELELKEELTLCQKCKMKKKKKERGLDAEEYYLNKDFKSVKDSLKLFQNDDLLCKPGQEFHYSSHAWTLISAVLEGCVEKSTNHQKSVKFENLIRSMFKEWGLNDTYLDENSPLINNRAEYYRRDKRGHLFNIPAVNNSYKWAGGGYLSNVEDLLKFSSILGQIFSRNLTKFGLNCEILRQIWSPAVKTQNSYYGMGWFVEPWPAGRTQSRDFLAMTVQKDDHLWTLDDQEFYVYHAGGAIGASSFLLIKPKNHDGYSAAVVILTNLHECGGLHKLATDLCALFLEEW